MGNRIQVAAERMEEIALNLFEQFYEDCIRLQSQRTPDGQGGFHNAWKEGKRFRAAITTDGATSAHIADKDAPAGSYTITLPKGERLEFHAVFRRLKDGHTYRVTSDPDAQQTPVVASFQFKYATCERWELPT